MIDSFPDGGAGVDVDSDDRMGIFAHDPGYQRNLVNVQVMRNAVDADRGNPDRQNNLIRETVADRQEPHISRSSSRIWRLRSNSSVTYQ